VIDPIPDLLKLVDPDRIRRDVDALAAFHTRHVASGEPNIGAAAAYLGRRFEEAGAGRLKVYLDSFEEEVPRLGGMRLRMSNVVGELPGTAGGRTLVVGGHYDSRCTDPADASGRAPGANDDASGVALTLELARLLSTREWPCTLVFIAFTGEEMGLFGARNWARNAHAAGRDIAAMLNNDMVGNTTAFDGSRCDDRVRIFSEGMQSAGDSAQIRRLGVGLAIPPAGALRRGHRRSLHAGIRSRRGDAARPARARG
jgi:acetylornithine deacetylase/succinyl-diaminopimelate desuccinylase-like protein